MTRLTTWHQKLAANDRPVVIALGIRPQASADALRAVAALVIERVEELTSASERVG